MEFDWDEANLKHILEDRNHNVSIRELEEVIQGAPLIYRARYMDGEPRFNYVGPTASGRLLFVVTTMRGEAVRIITGYPASAEMARFYHEHHKEDLK